MLPQKSFMLPESVAHAREIQSALYSNLKLKNDFGTIKTVAGIDVGYDMNKNMARASIVVMSLAELIPIESRIAEVPAEFPYVPGLLSFREIPAIIAVLNSFSQLPDMFMVDGHGIAHPRRMGIAAHLGVIYDIPAIGVAKSRLTGSYDMPGAKKGERSPLMSGNQRIGTVLRSRNNVAPLFISPGHRIDIETSVDLTVQCLTNYRLPEPTRIADKLSKFKSIKPYAAA